MWKVPCVHDAVHTWPFVHVYKADTRGAQRWPCIFTAGRHRRSAEPQLHAPESAFIFSPVRRDLRSSWQHKLRSILCSAGGLMCSAALMSTTVTWCSKCFLSVKSFKSLCDGTLAASCPLLHSFTIRLVLGLIRVEAKTKELSERATGQNPHLSPSPTTAQQALCITPADNKQLCVLCAGVLLD